MYGDKVIYFVKPMRYRDRDGFHVGSRNGGWNTAIFTLTREGAEMIRDSLSAYLDGFITYDEMEAIEGYVFFDLEAADAVRSVA